jgi:hypothetical protein
LWPAAGWADPYVSVALATASRQLAAIRASELEPVSIRCCMDCVTKISNYLLARP